MTPTRDPVLIIAVMLGWFLWILFAGLAHAHDPNRPELDAWFDGLQAQGKWWCCNRREAKELDDSDWDTKDSHYRVRLNGEWYDVPDKSLVIDKNLVGHALVWITLGYSGSSGDRSITIRCFLPGTMT
jgi:hypothetical protein